MLEGTVWSGLASAPTTLTGDFTFYTRDKASNNRVERLHGTVRDRDKVMRALDNEDSARRFPDGFEVYYNFIRPHMALGGQTPAEAAQIQLGLGGNRWEDMIKKAARGHSLKKNQP